MQRLSELDIPARLAPVMPGWVAEVLTALACFAVMALGRFAIDLFLPSVAPLALLFPFGLLATLLAGWRAGALAFYGGQLASWYYVMGPAGFSGDQRQVASLVIVAITGGLTLAVAQVFRDSARRATAERAAKLEERELLLAELNHRVSNNFQVVASILQLQRNRAQEPAAREALTAALNRVMSISQAHRNLYLAGPDVERVDMSVYLPDLCHNLAEALLLGDIVVLDVEAGPCSMERDRAVAIGLIVNELVTNAAKHAFDGKDSGAITVTFLPEGEGWRLTVSDDGAGLPKDFAKSRKGLGRGLVDAFARQAGGQLTILEGDGATFVLDLKE